MPKRQMKVQLLTLAVASALASGSALATNGYALHGIGMHAKGMGGASIALPLDAVSIGQNPAASAVVGNRADVGLDIFRPIRETTLSQTGNPMTNMPPPGFFDGNFDGSESEWFFIPEAGYNRVIDSKWSAGVSLFGNGGMNTDYASPGVPLVNSNPMTGSLRASSRGASRPSTTRSRPPARATWRTTAPTGRGASASASAGSVS